MNDDKSLIPHVTVSTLENGEIQPQTLRGLLSNGTYILVGVPGAYTPICTADHIPSLIKHIDDFKQMGVDHVYCISDDNPWALEEWAKTMEGSEAITFLSDGNRDFLNECKVTNDLRDLFIAGRYGRFYMIVKDGKITRLRAERLATDTTCTSGDAIMHDLRLAADVTRYG